MIQQWFKAGAAASAIALSALLASPSQVQAQEEGPNLGNVYMSTGFDVTTQYYFRGIFQENEGVIVQPWLDFGITLFEGEDVTIDVYSGFWNSIHSGPSGSDGNNGDAWYELDWYSGVAIGLPAGFTLDVSYINLYNPNGGTSFAEEIDVALSYDDSELMGDFAMSPYVLVAFEIDGGSDAFGEEGTYLELGVEPSFTVVESEDYPVELSIPVAVGLSIDDYYQDATGDDETFGFASVGATLGMPLTFIPADYGSWSASAGVTALFLGNNTDDSVYPGADDFEIVGTVGLSMSY